MISTSEEIHELWLFSTFEKSSCGRLSIDMASLECLQQNVSIGTIHSSHVRKKPTRPFVAFEMFSLGKTPLANRARSQHHIIRSLKPAEKPHDVVLPQSMMGFKNVESW
jgi:hypothetical protein